jgi:antitoxin component of RelBE/YafQ-DinJ toxin-antitoxin module
MGGSHTSADVDMMCTYESDEGQMPIDRVVKRDGCNRGTTFAIFENVYGR